MSNYWSEDVSISNVHEMASWFTRVSIIERNSVTSTDCKGHEKHLKFTMMKQSDKMWTLSGSLPKSNHLFLLLPWQRVWKISNYKWWMQDCDRLDSGRYAVWSIKAEKDNALPGCLGMGNEKVWMWSNNAWNTFWRKGNWNWGAMRSVWRGRTLEALCEETWDLGCSYDTFFVWEWIAIQKSTLTCWMKHQESWIRLTTFQRILIITIKTTLQNPCFWKHCSLSNHDYD